MRTLRQFLVFGVVVSLAQSLKAQDYNHNYDFDNPNYAHYNSSHTAGVQLTNENIAAGGTILGPTTSSLFQLEISEIDKLSGLLVANPHFYTAADAHLEMVDMMESVSNPDHVIVLANLRDTILNRDELVIFKASPSTGAIIWSRGVGATTTQMSGAAITSNGAGTFFIAATMPRVGLTGVNSIYLSAINDAGGVVWENQYHTNIVGESFEAVDLVFSPNTNNVAITGNFYNAMANNGVFIMTVAAGTGAVVADDWLATISGSAAFEVTDITLNFNRYALVGRYFDGMNNGFLAQYNLALVPSVPFVSRYSNPAGNDLYFTGVKPSPNTLDYYISYDYSDEGTLKPGIFKTDFSGGPLETYFYDVDGYKGSRGLIPFRSPTATGYVIKGASDASAAPGIPSLSLVGTKLPLMSNTATCPDTTIINDFNTGVNLPINFLRASRTLGKLRAVTSDEGLGDVYNCMDDLIAPITTPLSIPEEPSEQFSMEVYPNPSNGSFIVRLDTEMLSEIDRIEVCNLLGEKVLSVYSITPNIPIELSGAKGIYVLSAVNKYGHVMNVKQLVLQ